MKPDYILIKWFSPFCNLSGEVRIARMSRYRVDSVAPTALWYVLGAKTQEVLAKNEVTVEEVD